MLCIQMETVDALQTLVRELCILLYVQEFVQYDIESIILHDELFEKVRTDAIPYLHEMQKEAVREMEDLVSRKNFVVSR